MYAESYVIHALSVCRGPGLCQDSRIARNSILYSLLYILRIVADAMDVMRYQVASGVDMACVYSPTQALAPALAVTSQHSDRHIE